MLPFVFDTSNMLPFVTIQYLLHAAICVMNQSSSQIIPSGRMPRITCTLLLLKSSISNDMDTSMFGIHIRVSLVVRFIGLNCQEFFLTIFLLYPASNQTSLKESFVFAMMRSCVVR